MVGIYAIKPAFQRSLRGVEDWLVARGVHPDTLTYTALGLSILGGACLYLAPDRPLLLLLVPVVVLVRTALNALDGLVAKRTGLARPWGEVLNESCDRLADVSLFGGIALAPGVNHLVGAITLVAVLLGSYIGILSKAAGGPRQYGGPMGKADRMILLALAAPLGLGLPVARVFDVLLGVVLVGVLVMAALRARATYRDLQPAG
jgi:CDP-diacylglycerol--glycerol-3-phosphate 3-phosphatidyltransferase